MARKSIKIAYLVLCHKNAEQVNLLTRELCRLGDDVYLHWNKKPCNAPLPIENEQIHILPYEDSISVGWGDFSICLAELKMIREALKKPYDYLFCLSGQDFPLVSQEEIHRRLEEAEDDNFINIIAPGDKHYRAFQKRNQVIHRPSMRGNTLRARIIRNLWYLVSGGKKNTFSCFQKKSPFQTLYYGSNWWCLTADALREMLAYYDRHPEIEAFFSTSVCSDECLFQSLFMETPYKEKQRPSLTYVDWSQHKSSPKIMTMADWNTLMDQSHEKCMARKFDFSTDREILNALQKKMNLTKEKA